MHVIFLFAFSSRFTKIRTSNFCKVVRQPTEGTMGSIIWLLLEITSISSSERILKIRLELIKLSPWVSCTTFFGTHSVYFMGWGTKLLWAGILNFSINSAWERWATPSGMQHQLRMGEMSHAKWDAHGRDEPRQVGCLFYLRLIKVFTDW